MKTKEEEARRGVFVIADLDSASADDAVTLLRSGPSFKCKERRKEGKKDLQPSCQAVVQLFVRVVWCV
jgi:hypothetical protein